MATPSETLAHALRRLWQTKWKHQASGKSTLSQAEIAVRTLQAQAADWIDQMTVSEARGHVLAATAIWYTFGTSSATINKRLSCLSAMGVQLEEGAYQRTPKQPKWWLTPSMEADLVKSFADPEDRPYVAFVQWTTRTGLRVEESLAIRWEDLDGGVIRVRGTKTASSAATLPLGADAENLLAHRYAARTGYHDAGPFPFSYEDLRAWWQTARTHLAAQDEPTATLKALRRSAARYLHVDCGMPLHMVQQYLRHESMKTTLEYLRLTGGYGTEEMRRYLK